MSAPWIHAANAAQQFFLSLIDVAQLPDWRESIPKIAADALCSEKTIEKRLRAIRWFLEQEILGEVIAGWGAEKTISDWQRAVNLRDGKQPGTHVRWTSLVPKEQAEALDAMISRLRTLTACSREDALLLIERHFADMEDSDIQYLGQVGI